MRTTALVSLAALPVFVIFPGAVGSNIARLAWVCAVPVLVACARLDRRWLVVATLGLAVWPSIDMIEQVRWMPDPTTRAGYYQPLLHELGTARDAAGPNGLGERVEVLDTINHSGSVYVARAFAIARGWDRQADMASNPIFYHDDALNAASYRTWLHQLAVGWVAVPATRLDYGATAERDLVNSGLPYLKMIWSSTDWRLYRVSDATPLATGAQVTAVHASSVTLHTAAAATVQLRVRWTPYLRVVDPASGDAEPACISRMGEWTKLGLPAAGDYSVVSNFDPAARFRTQDDCGR